MGISPDLKIRRRGFCPGANAQADNGIYERPLWVGNRPLLLAEFTAIPLAAFDHDIQQRAQRNEYQGEQQVGKHAEAGIVARSGVPHHPCRSEPCLQGEVDHYLEIAHGTKSERQRGMGPSARAADLAERSGQYSPPHKTLNEPTPRPSASGSSNFSERSVISSRVLPQLMSLI